MRRIALGLQAALSLLFITSVAFAARPVFVNIDSLRDNSAPEKQTYFLYPGVPGVQLTDLQFKEFAAYVDRALQARGFQPVQEPREAGVIIFISYGIGPPQQTTYSYPLIGQTGGGRQSFTANTYGSGGTSHTTGTVSSSRRVGVVGTGTGTRTSYLRWAMLDAIDVAAFMQSEQTVQVWRTTITSSGSSSDLREIFPVLIAAAQPHLATNTEKQLHEKLRLKSKEVLAIKGEPPG